MELAVVAQQRGEGRRRHGQRRDGPLGQRRGRAEATGQEKRDGTEDDGSHGPHLALRRMNLVARSLQRAPERRRQGFGPAPASTCVAVSPRRAALLSALWVGLGQWSLGQRGRGAALMLLWAFGLALLALVSAALPFLIVAWVWGVYDARALALRLGVAAHPPTEGPYRTCASCGALTPLDYARCPGCGARLDAPR